MLYKTLRSVRTGLIVGGLTTLIAMPVCREVYPLQDEPGPGRTVYCHLYEECTPADVGG